MFPDSEAIKAIFFKEQFEKLKDSMRDDYEFLDFLEYCKTRIEKEDNE